VLDDAYIKTLIQKAAEFGNGKIHIIVNNAGYTWDGVIHKMTDKQWHTIVDLHATAPFKIVREAAPYFRVKDGEPRNIINISSTSGVNGNAGQINYALAKAGVTGMTKTIAKEYVPPLPYPPGLTRVQMGSSLWCARKHSCIWTHPDATDGCKGGWRVHHNGGRREGCARHTAGAEVGGSQGHGARGHPTEATRFGDGGSERRTCCCESVDVVCQWRDNSSNWWAGNVDRMNIEALKLHFET
jgi:hypothetical protein